MSTAFLWDRYRQHLCRVEPLGLTLDISRMRFDDTLFQRMAAPMARAFDAMAALEEGAVANPDEQRRVGHYWLRAPELAPEAALTAAIVAAQRQVREFAAAVHAGSIPPPRTWWCCPTRIACFSSRATCSSWSWNRSARNATSTASSCTRASRCTATRALPTSTPTCRSYATAWTTSSSRLFRC